MRSFGYLLISDECANGSEQLNFLLFTIQGIQNPGKTLTLVVRGSNKLVLEEADRSLHDALCVIRCLVRKKALVAGGGAPEIELALKLSALANTLEGVDAICLRAYAQALEIIPFTLAENAGLNPIQVRKKFQFE